MYKPKSLRKALTDAVPVLARNPDMMRVFIDNGNLASTLATSLSFENRYTLNVVVTDFTDDIELLLVPIQAWLRIHQADIMTTDEGRKKGFTYFADINDSTDISISLMLTERTLVKEQGDKLHVEQAEEPQPPEPVTRPVELYVNGELVSRLHE
ncbi:phage tail protein [Citrobacter portucalensis]|uniref:phage tail protein n=1 Tax=Citrobacter portucalensis TaxID=1639133 RepID=UPI0009AF0D58|nr:phage tail protein [Citrobacter portucalensis]OPW89495.1 phage tail protein [Citrobacter portucalensis]